MLTPTPREEELLRAFRQMHPATQDAMLHTIQGIARNYQREMELRRAAHRNRLRLVKS